MAFGGYDWALENGNIDMTYGYNAETKSFYASEVDMAYVDLTSLKENGQTTSIKVYPVPAENEIFIQTDNFQKVEVYSLTGQKLMESLHCKMNISTLVSGVYLLKVYNEAGESQMQKFVVK